MAPGSRSLSRLGILLDSASGICPSSSAQGPVGPGHVWVGRPLGHLLVSVMSSHADVPAVDREQ
jgi:hypothetical protein